MTSFTIKGNYVDIENANNYPAEIIIENGLIKSVTRIFENLNTYILPGFIDAHVHIESSLMAPSEFARLAVTHGTVATISDPHEIANVCGMDGVNFMIENGKTVPFNFFFGAPSCVPATSFETAGASLSANEVDALLQNPDILYLSEMMNFPGVLNQDPEVMAKIGSAQKYNKPIDGHAPGLMGNNARNYFAAGITTDHECFTLEEAEEKLKLGVNILIREGSAARNFDALIPLLDKYYNQIMFCSDDKHPDSLVLGHINSLVVKAIALGNDLYKVLKAACINPILHYKLPVGYLKNGHPADFIVVDNFTDFNVKQTFIKGVLVAENSKSLIKSASVSVINNFTIEPISVSHLSSEPKEKQEVIECLNGQLITNKLLVEKENCTPENDILKLVVVNRYQQAPIAEAYVKNFGLKLGAIASSVAHDSHNIIAVGINDEEICNAINLVINSRGGLSAVNQDSKHILPLEIAGLMSKNNAEKVAEDYTHLDDFAKQVLGSTLNAPFMSLSFMALLVIPHLKLSDLGLFDGDSFTFINCC